MDFIKQFKEYKTAVFFNGGKDSIVLLDLIQRAELQMPIIFVEKPDEFPEILKFIENVNVVKVNDMKEAIRNLIETEQVTHIFTGIRKNDPFQTEMVQKTDKDWPQVYLVNPLLNWNYSDIWRYILDRKLPYPSLYDEGYTSLGQINNTFKNSLLFTGNGYQKACELKDGRYERYGRINCKLPLKVEGIVIHGHKNGKKIGFPTANISVQNIVLDFGIYYGTLLFEGELKKFVMSYGFNTVYGTSEYATLELHIIDLQTDDFYGKLLKFEIIGFIRPMEKLSVSELIDAINRDIEIANI